MVFNDFEVNPQDFHSKLSRHNLKKLRADFPSEFWESDEKHNFEFKIYEGRYLESLRHSIQSLVPPHDITIDQFVAWFESLSSWGPGQNHPLFQWLADEASITELKWFLTQEIAGEAGFDDLLAYTQVKLPVRAKLECARNFWDEMGRGKQAAMHGLLLERIVQDLNLSPDIDSTVWESLALNNAMIGMATTRRYAYHSIGALGAIELTAPQRSSLIASGMKRLGIDPKTRAYFDLHSAVDILHSQCWIEEVIRTLITLFPECKRYIAEGALMRLYCGKLCFDRYRKELSPRSLFQKECIERSLS